MKKIMSLMLALVLLTMPLQFADTTSGATDDNTAVSLNLNDPPVTYITLDKAIELAEAHDTTLQSIDLKIEIAKRDLKDLESDLKDPDLSHSNADEYEQIVLNKLYEPKNKQKAIDDLEIQKEQTKDTLRVSVTESYLNYQKVLDAYNNAQTALEDAQTTYKNNVIKHDLGQMTDLDLQNALISQLQAEYNLYDADQALTLERMTFNQLVGNPIHTDFTLTSAIDTTVKASDYDVESMVRNIEKYSDAIRVAEENLEMAELKFEVVDDNMLSQEVTVNGLTRNNYGWPTDYVAMQDDIKELKTDLEKAQNEAVLDLRIAYNNLKSAQVDSKMKALSVETAKTTYETNKLKKDLGMVTEQTFQQSLQAYKEAIQASHESDNAYYIQSLTFENAVKVYGIDEETSADDESTEE